MSIWNSNNLITFLKQMFSVGTHDSIPVHVSLIRVKTHFFTAAFVGDALETFQIHILNGLKNGTADLSVLRRVSNHKRCVGLPLYYKGATGDSGGVCDSSSSVSVWVVF